MIPWRRKWQSTPVLLPGKSHGQRSLVGHSLWGRNELDTTEWLHFPFLVWVLKISFVLFTKGFSWLNFIFHSLYSSLWKCYHLFRPVFLIGWAYVPWDPWQALSFWGGHGSMGERSPMCSSSHSLEQTDKHSRTLLLFFFFFFSLPSVHPTFTPTSWS